MPIDHLEKFKNIRHDTFFSPEPEFDDKTLGKLPQILLQRCVVSNQLQFQSKASAFHHRQITAPFVTKYGVAFLSEKLNFNKLRNFCLFLGVLLLSAMNTRISLTPFQLLPGKHRKKLFHTNICQIKLNYAR